MLVLLDLSLCLAFPTVRESVSVRRNSKNEKTTVLSPSRRTCSSACWGCLNTTSLLSAMQGQQRGEQAQGGGCKRAVTRPTRQVKIAQDQERNTALHVPSITQEPLHPKEETISGRNGCDWFQQKLRRSALPRSSIVAGFRVHFGQWTHYW